MFDPPDGVGLVPNVIFCCSWWESHVLMSCFSMQDSGLFPLGRVPKPSRQEAFGKLKSPDRIMSGTGVLRLAIVLLI